MLLNNNSKDYTQKQLNDLNKRALRLIKILEVIRTSYKKELETPSVLKDQITPIYVNTRPLIESKRWEKRVVNLEELISVYESWMEITQTMVQNNLGHFKNKKVLEIITSLVELVTMFHSIMKKP